MKLAGFFSWKPEGQQFKLVKFSGINVVGEGNQDKSLQGNPGVTRRKKADKGLHREGGKTPPLPSPLNLASPTP